MDDVVKGTPQGTIDVETHLLVAFAANYRDLAARLRKRAEAELEVAASLERAASTIDETAVERTRVEFDPPVVPCRDASGLAFGVDPSGRQI